MPTNKFVDIFGDYVSSESAAALSLGVIDKCELSLEERSLDLGVSFKEYIKAEMLHKAQNEIKSALSLDVLNFKASFSAASFNIDAVVDLTNEIKNKTAAFNGYFNGADYALEDGRVTVTLKFGGLSAVKKLHYDLKLKNLISELFGIEIEVDILGEDELSAPDTPEEPIVKAAPASKPQSASAAPAPEKPKKVYSGKPQDGLPVYIESATLFYGRGIDRNIKPLSEYIPLGDPGAEAKFVGWGRVFDFDSRTVNTKRGPMLSCKFCFSDNTNSLEASLFIDEKRKGEIKPLKNGACVLINGIYLYDRWVDGFIVKVTSLATLEEYFEKEDREDTRIELHCHTNMSAKDAVSSAGDIINYAARLGQKAIAITDHGVVQAYPAAAGAVKKLRKNPDYADFKVIYGVEGYLVDDEKNDLSKLNSKEIGKLRRHIIMLVSDFVGLKNLYKLVSEAHLNDFHGRPCTLKSKLKAHREGLIIGSACEAGELYTAIVDGENDEKLKEIAEFYDYLEIQPVGNNEFMVRASAEPDHVDKRNGTVTPNRLRHVRSLDVIREFNRKVVGLGEEMGKLVVATGDVHFLKKEDEIIRKVLLAGQGFEDFDHQAPLYLHTTAEMLEEFSYLGEEKAYEIVVTNPNAISDRISPDIIPVPEGNYPPVIEGSDDELREICRKRARAMYGDPLPPYVEERLEKELNGIISNGYSIMYMAAQRLVKYSEDNGYLVGSRGSVGSSFVATMAGISEVNPLAPHYYCPKCQYNDFFLKGEVGSGFDLPEKNCPVCGEPLCRDGHDIPFETFLGFKGDKVPDIDLNFSDAFQSEVQKYTEQLFGRENVFKAGTISTIAEKTAFGFAKAYAEKKNIVLSGAELKRIAGLLRDSEVKATTGQHPAGMIVVPRDKEIYDFCPVQHPADDVNSDIITTHFDFHSIHDTILKLDELGHVVPTTYKYLEEFSGIPVASVSMSDPAVYSLFTSTKALGVTPDEIFSQNGTFCIPEFGTDFVRGMLLDCKPQNFADLLQISGLSHGTDVYLGNAKDLIDKGICTISEVIGTRDNIMVYLIHQGLDSGRAFKITETVRKGLIAKGVVSAEEWNGMADDMREHGVPEWYIESCRKIKYMFPKAHAAAYVISALRLAWYKVHRPIEFYCAYFTARPEDIEVETVMRGKEAVRARIRSIQAKGKEATPKETDVYNKLLIINEMLSRGLEILPIDLYKSHATRYELEDGKMRLPFCALSGVGDKAAEALYAAAQEGDFISKDEFQAAAGVSKTIVQSLSDIGALGDLPDSNQMTLF